MKSYIHSYLLLTSLLLALLCSCSDESFISENDGNSGRPLAPGEVCNITFINSVGSISEATTRSIPEGKKSVLHDFTNQKVKGKDGSNAGWISGEVRTRYDEDVERATTRSFDAGTQLFGKNSEFRMLVFAGSYGGTVDMSKPIANVVCKVNENGNGATFANSSPELGLLKGRYTFICFPAADKYNKWGIEDEGYKIPIGKDEDFVCLHLPNVDINTQQQSIDLSQFKRYGYQLTVKFSISEDLGYLISPENGLELTISDDGKRTDEHVINTSAIFNLKNQSIDYSGNTASFKDTLQVEGEPEPGQVFTAVSNFLIANESAEQKLTIKYPELIIMKPKGTDGSLEDSVFTIKPGTYTTSETVQFKSGNSYTITLTMGERLKGYIVGGVIWSPGNLDYNATTGEFFWAPTPDKAKNAREARGAWFRWMAPLSQNAQISPSDESPITKSWTFTFDWNGNDLGNYNNYYKTIFNDDSNLMVGLLPSVLEVTTLGDPCWGVEKGWRMPTYNEINILCYQASSNMPTGSESFTDARNMYGGALKSYFGSFNDNIKDDDARYAGIFITACKKATENPKSITDKSQYDCSQLFLPAAGYSKGNEIFNIGVNGYYWSSTPNSKSTTYSWHINFGNDDLNRGNGTRAYGYSVRCVLGE